jgi:hypothetical protein
MGTGEVELYEGVQVEAGLAGYVFVLFHDGTLWHMYLGNDGFVPLDV